MKPFTLFVRLIAVFGIMMIFATSGWNSTLSYDNTAGTGTIASVSKSSGTTITLSDGTGFSRSGYVLSEWNTKKDGSGTSYALSSNYTFTNKDRTLYAIWTSLPTYSVTYNNNNGSGSVTDSNSYTSGSQVTVKSGSGLTKSGFAFKGWNTAQNGTGTTYQPGDTFNITTNTTLYAIWTSAYSLTYNSNGGSGTVSDSNSPYIPNSLVTVKDGSNLTKTNYKFVGWNTNQNGTGSTYQAGATFNITTNTTLYAMWAIAYTVTYNINNGTGTVPTDSTKYDSGATVSVMDGSALTRTNYTFGGWNTNSSGTGITYQLNNTFTISASTILYAKWDPIPVTPKISITDASNIEGNSGKKAIIFQVTLDNATNQEVKVDYHTEQSTLVNYAISGNDYDAITTTTLRFPVGTTSQVISVSAIGDTVNEPNEKFYVILSNPINATITDGNATGTIINDDGGTIASSSEREFSLRNPVDTQIIKGDKIVIGNTVECVTTSTTAYGAACTDDLTKNDNAYFVKYLDVDSNTSTFNSSEANLTVPANTHVVWAGLYWQGNIHSNDSKNRLGTTTAGTYASTFTTVDLTNLSANYDAHKILFKHPNSAAYTTVTAEQLDVSHYYSNNSGDIYNAFADVTSLVSESGMYRVANVKTMEGLESGLGNYGAWSLVVIYKADNSTTTTLAPKNISIFDGYKKISGSTDAIIPIIGFKTPLDSTQIVASLSTFLGEGEYAYSGDNITFDGKNIPGATANNIADAQITGNFVRNPTYINTNGIDIDTFDISTLLTSGQTKATVTLSSSKDVYWASMIAFSADLYVPNVCYDQTFTDLSGNAITKLDVGTPFLVNTMIGNKDKAGQPAETAEDVIVELTWDKNLAYTTSKGNTSFQNVGALGYSVMSDPVDTDNVEFLSDINSSRMYVGTGAVGSKGGILSVNAESHMKTTITAQSVPSNGLIDNTYRASFYSPTAGVIPLSVIDPCTSVDKTLNVSASGAYQAVEVGGACGSEMNTKIVGQAFDVDIVSCDTGNNLINSSGVVDINFTDGTKKAIAGSPAISSLTFNSQNRKTVTIPAYSNAIKSINLSTKKSTDTSFTGISNSFAIRPDKFDITTAAAGNIVAGTNFQLTFKGLDATGNPAAAYADTAGTNFSVTFTEALGAPCIVGAFNPIIKNGWQFTDGKNDFTTNYSEVGAVSITLDETTKACTSRFAAIDCTDVNQANLSIAAVTKTFNFIPNNFNVTANIVNQGNGFTYLSTALANMSAQIQMTVTAQNALGAATQNYQAACYAKNTNYTIGYGAINTTPNALTQINFDETLTTTTGNQNPIGTQFVLNNLAPAPLFIAATPGIANPIVRVNFTRNNTQEVNPFNFTVNQVTVTDTDGVTGTQNPAQAALFYYGRVHAPDYRFTAPINGGNYNGNGRLYYEVYCGGAGCNNALLPLTHPMSDDTSWFMNGDHVEATDGTIGVVPNVGSIVVNANQVAVGGAFVGIAAGNGFTTRGFSYNGGQGFPYKQIMDIPNKSAWLDFNPTTFEIEFLQGGGQWVGEIKNSTTTDSQAPAATNRRIVW
ncbi:MAG: InlB B-repeat-containing protein [Sulfuricurvum sp.]|nr:InlB B-repeat-containing protein [Sulfuricurvum sp.]